MLLGILILLSPASSSGVRIEEGGGWERREEKGRDSKRERENVFERGGERKSKRL